MRKITASVLVLVAMLAIVGSAISVFAKPADSNAAYTAHPDYILRSIIGSTLQKSGGNGLTPAQFRKAYGVSAFKDKGKGITIAIIDACGNTGAQSDLNMYDSTYGLPAITIKVVMPEGPPCSNANWGVETDLDLQMAHSIAPHASLVLEEAKSGSNNNIFNAVKDAYNNQGATVVSMSFGEPEFSGETGSSADGIFSAGNAIGVSFTASSGDSGCGSQYPAASPYVTSVGGTSLKTQSDGTYISESAWNGSGGGTSIYEARPSYQKGFNSNRQRGIPDVAMDADPNTGVSMYDAQVGGFLIVGGTSVAAPMWAGVLALADHGRTSSMKNADHELYNVAGNSSKYASDFHDITTGGSGGSCIAKTGYDLVTGLGSPVVNALVPDLIAAP